MKQTFNHRKALGGLLDAVRRGLGSTADATTRESLTVVANDIEILMGYLDSAENFASKNQILITLGGIHDRIQLLSEVDGYDPEQPAGGWWTSACDYGDGQGGAS